MDIILLLAEDTGDWKTLFFLLFWAVTAVVSFWLGWQMHKESLMTVKHDGVIKKDGRYSKVEDNDHE